MQLRKLEAYGFKSFADKLEIEFDKGITAIVGPNGSGKSNVTDAIKWVLGEQNVRNLRAARTEDIIFAGSATRRALGIAEVSLTFDNTDGQLPIEFQEVVVTRRIFRSGESEYYINKARCRLKDIHDLFADTGLGRDGISVISQNKIDQVLNSRPEERRLLFEEAAGITKFRNRKKESLRKLEETEQNLLRVSDIISEIENQLEPLAKHAEKTRRYNELKEIYDTCDLTVALNNYEQYRRLTHEAQKEKTGAEDRSRNFEIEMNLLEVEKDRAGSEMAEVEKSMQLLTNKNRQIGEQIEKNLQDVAMQRERKRQADESLKKLRTEADDLRHVCGENAQQAAVAAAELLAGHEKELQYRGKLTLQMELEASVLEMIHAVEAEAARMQTSGQKSIEALADARGDLLLAKRDLQDVAGLKASLEEKKCLTNEKLQFMEQERALLLQNRAGELQKAEQGTKQWTELETQRDISRQDSDVVAAKRRAALDACNAAETRLHILNGMQQEYEGFGRAVKNVLRSGQAWQKDVCGAVAELIQVPGDYATAIEIALGGGMQNVVTENDQTAKAAIAYLKREKLGRVTFLPLNTIQAKPKLNVHSTVGATGWVGYANELIDCDPKYRKAIDFLLDRTIVVTDLDAATALARAQNFRSRIVTLSGDLLNPGGSITGGSLGRRETGFLNRANEIEQLRAKIVALKKEAADYDDQIERLRDQSVLIGNSIEELRNARRQNEVYLAEIKVKIAQSETAIREQHGLQSAIQEDLAQAFAEESRLTGKQQIVGATISELEATVQRGKEDDQSTMQQLGELNRQREAAAKITTECKIAHTVAEQEILHTEALLDSVRQRNEEYTARLASAEGEIVSAENAISSSAEALKFLNAENVRLGDLRAIGQKDYENFEKVKYDKMSGIQETEKKIKERRKSLQEMQSKMHEMDLLYTKYAFEADRCHEKISQQYGLTIEAAHEKRLPESNSVLTRRMTELKSQIDAMGTVNPNAIEAYEELRERHAFMKGQVDDLVAAKSYLAGIISEIDETMGKQFIAAFEEIQRHFSEIFVRLFGGGKAELALSSGEEILEAGVEISVQPPDKKMQSLSVLSGGERALTVAALLFALLRYKPAPFSVVDEIDAPLDEANVARFGSFLQEYARDTQFIVVTHRKGTMQVADVLHGVTVEDSGVSRIISVKLEE